MTQMFRPNLLPRTREGFARGFGAPQARADYPPRLRTSRLIREVMRTTAVTITPTIIFGAKPIVAAEIVIIVPPGAVLQPAVTLNCIDLTGLVPGTRVHIYNYGTISGGLASGKVGDGIALVGGPDGTKTYLYNSGTLTQNGTVIQNARNVIIRSTGTIVGTITQ